MIPKFEDEMKLIKQTTQFINKLNETVVCPSCGRTILNPYEKEIVMQQDRCVDCDKDAYKRMEDYGI